MSFCIFPAKIDKICMKKSIYYYSEDKLQYLEVKNFYSKFLSMVSIFSILSAFILFGGYYVVSNIIYPAGNIEKIKSENLALKEKFKKISGEVNNLNNVIDKLRNKDHDLRLSVNLQPESPGEMNAGIGGSVFEPIIPSNISDMKNIVNNLDNSLDIVKSKIRLAENNYNEIETALKKNINLYKSIPAIMPAKGSFGDRFGMRLHPILKVRRMHEGVDILVNTGSDVFAPGNGKVIFAGRKHGYGRVVELDHGFGYTTLYAHLSKIEVKKGLKVKRGDLIALSGRSGELSTGPHLHYEVLHDGVHLNPENFIFSDMKAFDLITAKSSK